MSYMYCWLVEWLYWGITRGDQRPRGLMWNVKCWLPVNVLVGYLPKKTFSCLPQCFKSCLWASDAFGSMKSSNQTLKYTAKHHEPVKSEGKISSKQLSSSKKDVKGTKNKEKWNEATNSEREFQISENLLPAAKSWEVYAAKQHTC